MKHEHDTWYVLEDGSKASPDDVVADSDGILRHKDGLAVEMKGSVPHTSGVGPEPDATTGEGKKAKARTRELKADDNGKKYETR